jgi:hypothetical protein
VLKIASAGMASPSLEHVDGYLELGRDGVSFEHAGELWCALAGRAVRAAEATEGLAQVRDERARRLAIAERAAASDLDDPAMRAALATDGVVLSSPAALLELADRIAEHADPDAASRLADRALACLGALESPEERDREIRTRRVGWYLDAKRWDDARALLAREASGADRIWREYEAPMLDARALAGLGRYEEAMAIAWRHLSDDKARGWYFIWKDRLAAATGELTVAARVVHEKFGAGEVMAFLGLPSARTARVLFDRDDRERVVPVAALRRE